MDSTVEGVCPAPPTSAARTVLPRAAAQSEVIAQAPFSELQLSVVIPTFDESPNIALLIERLAKALDGINWEAIFVDDDSGDGTAEAVRRLAVRDRRIRILHRIGRRGLSSACIEGMLASPAPYIAVMDADLQHDEALLPQMLEILRRGEKDIVVGSRYVGTGSVGEWPAGRQTISRFATWLAHRALRADLTDPMSGFFMLRREVVTKTVRRLSGIGFKILFDVFASSPTPLRSAELPYTFRMRHAGESKLDTKVVSDFLMLLLDKLVGHIIPVRFLAFCLVGGIGVIVHFAVLAVAHKGMGLNFTPSQTVAALVAMTGNFFLNNVLTFRDQRLMGWRLLGGWLIFALGSSVGMLANVGVATYLFRTAGPWYASAFAGVLVGAVWNYAIASVYTWRMPRRT